VNDDMVRLILLLIRMLGYFVGAIGLFLSLLFFFAELKDNKKRLTRRSRRMASVSENPPLEVSRHG
jgi:hypothetical protein